MELDTIKMQILETGLLVLAAYIGGKVARRLGIGEVIGQIVGGILIGPHFLEIVHRFLENHPALSSVAVFKPIYHFYNAAFPEYARILEGYHFFVFLFLGVVAFSIGEELHRERLRQVGMAAFWICLVQALTTWLLLSAGFYFIFGFSPVMALLVGSIGIATAPALSFILMSKLKIEGRLRNVLANIVVLDDVIEVIVFSITLGVAMAEQRGGHVSALHLAGEVGLELLLALVIGVVIFLVLRLMVQQKLPEEEESEESGFLSAVVSDHPTPSIEILLIIFGVVAIGIAVAIQFDLPFLITAVVAGILISNFHSNAIFDSLKLRDVMPLFNLLFFAIIGASVRIESFSADTLLYVLGYVALRTAGKLGGNWLGCKITDQDPKITAALPRLMLPQAGMAAVETILVAKALAQSGGMVIFNTIVPALVIFEIAGAYLSEKTLLKWKSWVTGEREALRASRAASGGPALSQLVEDRVIQMVAKNKNDALFELVRALAEREHIPDTSRLLSAIREREMLAHTTSGNGIAFPHCRSEEVSRPLVVCGVTDDPISWGTPPGKGKNGEAEKIDLVFLIISPAEDPEQHLKALRTIGIALRTEGFRPALKEAARQDLVDEFFKNYELEGSVSV